MLSLRTRPPWRPRRSWSTAITSGFSRIAANSGRMERRSLDLFNTSMQIADRAGAHQQRSGHDGPQGQLCFGLLHNATFANGRSNIYLYTQPKVADDEHVCETSQRRQRIHSRHTGIIPSSCQQQQVNEDEAPHITFAPGLAAGMVCDCTEANQSMIDTTLRQSSYCEQP